MKKQPVSPNRTLSCCLSPADVWHTLLAYLLEKHYGLTLSDTPFSGKGAIQAYIDAGICNFAFFSGLIGAQFWAERAQPKSPELDAKLLVSC